MRPVFSLALVASLAACEGTAPPPRRERTVANSRRSSSARARGRVAATPPAVDSVATCPREAVRALARYRQGRTLHFGPLCTDVYGGRFSAVMATGTEAEASDVWVIFHDTRSDEVHRVRRFPVGAHISFGRISQGWVYLLGRGNALDDMPAGGQLLAIFPLPRPADNVAPEIGLLSPLEAPLLRATDVEDLDRRLAFPVPPRDPPAREAQRLVADLAQRGPNALLDHLSPEGSPTLRAWQVGLFQETDYVSPQGDPTSPHLARAVALLRGLSSSMDCAAGDRCVARGDLAADPGVTRAQVFLRYEGQRIVVAAMLSGASAATFESASVPRPSWGAEAPGTPEDQALAESLTLDGAVQGAVVTAARGDARALAFQVSRALGGSETRLYVVQPDHAPRPYTDRSIGQVTLGSTELHLRDYERDGGLELVTLGRSRDDAPVFSVASVSAPATVSQHELTHRLDMLRATFGDTELRAFDSHLRSFRAYPSERDVACATLERIAGGDAHEFSSAVGASLATITYQESWQPLRGAPQRTARRELVRAGTAALGPFAGLRCADLSCDWSQSICRVASEDDRGILWFADGGRKIAAVSLRQSP